MNATFCRSGFVLLLLSGIVAHIQAAEAPKVASDQELGFIGDTRAAILARTKRVGILPTILPRGFEARSDVHASLEPILSDYLRRAGFEVIDSASYSAGLARFSRQLGGLYDPLSGRVKPDQFRAAYDNARRDYIETQHLDGYAIMKIEQVRAPFDRQYASWDMVYERSDGLFVKGFLGRFMHPGTATGSLMAYSVQLQVVSAENKVLFARRIGVQLGSYFNPVAGGKNENFLIVPNVSLFRDTQRMDRALRLATLPLVHTPQELAAGTLDPAINPDLVKLEELPVPPSGAADGPAVALKVPREQILGAVHRVLIMPLSSSEFNVSPQMADRYLEFIRSELKGLGWELSVSDKPGPLFVTAMRDAGGIFDTMTGAVNAAKVTEIRRSLFPALGVDPQPDAMLWVQLVGSAAEHRAGNVFWDGVNQSAVDLGPVRGGFLLSGSGRNYLGEGAVGVASVLLQLRDARDTLLYEGRGGIQVLQQFQGKTLTTLAPGELFKDPERDAAAVHAALAALVSVPVTTALQTDTGAH